MANFYTDNDDRASQVHNKVVEWLNEAAISSDAKIKVTCLEKAKEVIINSTADILDNFFEEVLNFQNDRNPSVRCFVLQFIEESCKKDPETLPKVMTTVQTLLGDQAPQVQKKTILVATQLFKICLMWISSGKLINDGMEAAWGAICDIKQKIVFMVDNDNDGIRTVSVKFLEAVILLQTYPEMDSLQQKDDFSLDDVPFTLKIAKRRKLEEEANAFFDLLIKFHGSPHISSLNLMTCMGSLVLIAKMRPQFMHKVVGALETLNVNLPPTLFKSQVSSVRKHLKSRLLSLLKQPAAFDLHPNITALLADLGATPAEINKNMPKQDEIRRVKAKRAAEAAELAAQAPLKKAKLDLKPAIEMDIDDDDDDEYDEPSKPIKETRETPKVETTTDITELFIFERLTVEMTTALVMQFIPRIPNTMPPHFSAAFTPISAAGMPAQIRHVARLLAAQMTASAAASTTPASKITKMHEGFMPKAPDPPPMVTAMKPEPKPVPKPPVDLSAKLSRLKSLKLSEITQPLEPKYREKMLESVVNRVLRGEKAAVEGGVSSTRAKILTSFATLFNPKLRQATVTFITSDIKRRMDLALSWLYEEYSFIQGYNKVPILFQREMSAEESYDELLCTLITHVSDRAKLDIKDRENLLSRLYLEVPHTTSTAMEILKTICTDETKASMGLKLLEDLVIKRPPENMEVLNALLVQTSHESSLIRNEALERVVKLYSRTDLSSIIEEYSIFYLGFLVCSMPPDVLFGEDRGRPIKTDVWTEDTIRVCIALFLAIVPVNEKLIHELARVYVATSSEVKRVVLRLLEVPVRGMGMHSPELLALLEDCPKGAETLVTRIIHLLTDKATPSEELVSRVRDLYNTRVSDVRFLIPVLTGLYKEEVIAALPKLIKLTPAVVKEVFTRLLSVHVDGTCAGPLTPVDLLVALHTLDPVVVDLKLVMKATSLCFAERQIYTQETLAIVMQYLMEIHPLPTLFMRTVIQSLSIYPRLLGFTINILQRLIHKQVWRQKKVWEGFIKCCQRTRPQSFQVLLQLPPNQLIDVFMECPELQKPLHDHVMTFTEHQRKHISKATIEILRGNKMVILDEEGEYPQFVPPETPMQLNVIEVKREKELPQEATITAEVLEKESPEVTTTVTA